MKKDNITLTEGEWNVMECLWESAPKTGREVADALNKTVGWSRTTTLTMLSRMTKKGIIRCVEDGGIKTYLPLIRRSDAVERETEDFIKRVYKGSVSLMMSAVAEKQELSREEIGELYAMLRRLEEGKK